MTLVNPYLHFNGNAEEAFNFYKSVFGGEFITVMRYKDGPGADKLPAGEGDKILHMSMPLGKGNFLMGSDVPTNIDFKLVVGNNYNLSVNTESGAETEKLYNGLAAGGQIRMPLAKTFWNAYFAMVTDKYGINWMLTYDLGQ